MSDEVITPATHVVYRRTILTNAFWLVAFYYTAFIPKTKKIKNINLKH